MLGQFIKFKKQLNNSSIYYDYYTSLGLTGSFLVEDDKIILMNLKGQYSDQDKYELIYLIKHHIVDNNFPDEYMYATG